jgi:hypothetical protein
VAGSEAAGASRPTETDSSSRTPSGIPGLAAIGRARWLVGSQTPLGVHEADLEPDGGARETRLPDESVYAVCVLPSEFAAPPRLEGHVVCSFWARATLPEGVPDSGLIGRIRAVENER